MKKIVPALLVNMQMAEEDKLVNDDHCSKQAFEVSSPLL